MKQKKRPWTPEELAVLCAAYPDTPTTALAASLGRTVLGVYHQAGAQALKKSAAYLDGPHASRLLRGGPPIGQATRYRKGSIPWNKGRKGYQAGGRSVETQFQPDRPANEAHNYRPIGSTRINSGILERKVTDDPDVYPARRWVPVHVQTWRRTHGDIPKGNIVVFRPGLHTTLEAEITLDRLECISRAELMRRNTYHRYPPEIAQAIQLKGALSRQINKRSQRP